AVVRRHHRAGLRGAPGRSRPAVGPAGIRGHAPPPGRGPAQARHATHRGAMTHRIEISLTVNGAAVTRSVAPRTTLVDFLRHDLGLTGSHVGCEHGICGACTVRLDGSTVRGCLTL